MSEKGFRVERDSMGEVSVPEDVYWGAQTQRAVENFTVSQSRFPREFIWALGIVKRAAAEVNLSLEFLDSRRADAIIQAASEVMEGDLDEHFVVDVFQTGSGTSTNMNANEVIANRANELLGSRTHGKDKVHPNDHVNLGQSSNDVIPTCIHLSSLEGIQRRMLPAMERLKHELARKSGQFKNVLKIGRTHLNDATPITLGQEFGGYASMVEHGIRRVENATIYLSELPVGGTAVGTGLNTHRLFSKRMVDRINELSGLTFCEAQDHFEAQGARDALVETSGALRSVAIGLMKIANDIRWMGSGPRCGIGELKLPEVQPGSSMMPGKVNPVIAESVCQVAAQVMGNDAVVAVGAMSGNFELNTMMPVMAHNLLQSIRLLGNVTVIFVERCIENLSADEERCKELVERSLAMCTALTPYIGYDAAAKMAKEAYERGITIRQVASGRGVLSSDELAAVLDPWSMIGPR